MLAGKRIFLRRLESGDLDRCHQWINNPSLYGIMGVFGPRTKLEQEHWYTTIADSKTNLVFAICSADTQEHIGNASIFSIDYRSRNAGITIFIAQEDFRGNGVGLEVVTILSAYAFDYLNLHKLYAKTDNPIAAKLYEKIGFQKEGEQREQAFYQGSYHNKLLYGLLRHEYSPMK